MTSQQTNPQGTPAPTGQATYRCGHPVDASDRSPRRSEEAECRLCSLHSMYALSGCSSRLRVAAGRHFEHLRGLLHGRYTRALENQDFELADRYRRESDECATGNARVRERLLDCQRRWISERQARWGWPTRAELDLWNLWSRDLPGMFEADKAVDEARWRAEESSGPGAVGAGRFHSASGRFHGA